MNLRPSSTYEERTTRENRLALMFRLRGYYRAAVLLERAGDDMALAYLDAWLALNQHIPAVYLVLGTEVFENNGIEFTFMDIPAPPSSVHDSFEETDAGSEQSDEE